MYVCMHVYIYIHMYRNHDPSEASGLQQHPVLALHDPRSLSHCWNTALIQTGPAPWVALDMLVTSFPKDPVMVPLWTIPGDSPVVALWVLYINPYTKHHWEGLSFIQDLLSACLGPPRYLMLPLDLVPRHGLFATVVGMPVCPLVGGTRCKDPRSLALRTWRGNALDTALKPPNYDQPCKAQTEARHSGVSKAHINLN